MQFARHTKLLEVERTSSKMEQEGAKATNYETSLWKTEKRQRDGELE